MIIVFIAFSINYMLILPTINDIKFNTFIEELVVNFIWFWNLNENQIRFNIKQMKEEENE